jgi:hypothetical protein
MSPVFCIDPFYDQRSAMSYELISEALIFPLDDLGYIENYL